VEPEDKKNKEQGHEQEKEPLGFGEHSRGLAAEFAHEQGWGLNEEERTRLPEGKQDFEGGTDYEYGARDFGDTAVDTSDVQPSPEAEKLVEDVKEGE
jgi:hypothetical protein